jgi:intron-binding protein aquarius
VLLACWGCALYSLLTAANPLPHRIEKQAVLESIRGSLNDTLVIPEWLTDVLLGYGDAGAAHYTALTEGRLRTVDFKDTFLDAAHLVEAFPQYDVTFVTPGGRHISASSVPGPSEAGASGSSSSSSPLPPPPYRVTFPADAEQLRVAPGSTKRGVDGGVPYQGAGGDAGDGGSRPPLLVESYTPLFMGPYPEDRPRSNDVRFTPVQVEAVCAGVQPGLTMVVGPPGTGKTDTAVQILQVLYANCPGQRTLLITHSNQALNDLFAKLAARDVPARYMLRLGMGEADLDVDDDFSRAGRVNNMLARRLTLLAQVCAASHRMLRACALPRPALALCRPLLT